MSCEAANAATRARVRVDTSVGAFEIDPKDLVHFPTGLPGFDRCRQFAIVTSPELGPFHGLCAVEGPQATFLTVDPHQVAPDYHCELTESDRVRLGVTDSTPLVWLAIVTLSEGGEAWVNLRAPIVIAADRMLGGQILPAESPYPVRQPLAGG